MQIRLFRGLGEPVWVNALSSACERLGPDPRRALGPAATPAASTGRTRDRTRPMLQNVRKFLPGRRPHVTPEPTLPDRRGMSAYQGNARCFASVPGLAEVNFGLPQARGEGVQAYRCGRPTAMEVMYD